MKHLILFSLIITFFQSCSTQKSPKIKYINSFEIPYNKKFDNTTVGGLSGIDYDTKNNQYYLISDDRSVFNNSRFYTVRIHINNQKLDNVEFIDVTYLKNKNQEFYSNYEISPQKSADPEDIRYDSKKKVIVWSNEGERLFTKNDTILIDPSITYVDTKGNYKGEFKIPRELHMTKKEIGSRRNGTIEGITFNKSYRELYACMEEPIYEDGNRATLKKGGIVRLLKYNSKKPKKEAKQYLYPIEPIAKSPIPLDAFAINGVSAILYYKKDKILVVERSFSSGNQKCNIKIFLCNLKKRTSQKGKIDILSKELLFDFNNLGIYIDNIEGVTYGPLSDDKKKSLIFVSDDNFSEKQKTQLLYFKIED